MRQKYLSFFLIFSLISLSLPVFALEEDPIKCEVSSVDELPDLTFEEVSQLSGATITSEYDIITSLHDSSANELKNLGFSTDEIDILKNSHPAQMILKDLPLNQTRLKLTSKEIEAVKNHQFDLVSPETLRRASAKVALGFGNISKRKNVSSYAIYWHWDRDPIWDFTDKVVSAFSDNYYATGSCTALVKYRSYNTDNTTFRTERYTPSDFPNNGVVFSIPMKIATYVGPVFALSGKAYVQIKGNTTPPKLLILAKYAHSYTPELVSVSIGAGPLSIQVPKSIDAANISRTI